MEMLFRDYAALLVMNDTGVTPRVYDAQYESDVSERCKLKIITMERVGNYHLDFAYERTGGMTEEQVIAIGRSAIRLIQAIHARGIIHGDIHAGNFVFSDPMDIPGTLKVIDFGRSTPYRTEDGQHIAEEDMRTVDFADTHWNPLFQSIHELSGSPVSRRDDMYRLAEMLVYLLVGDDDLYIKYIEPTTGLTQQMLPPQQKVKQKKRFRDLEEMGIPLSIRTLYYSAMWDNFESDPNYDVLDD